MTIGHDQKNAGPPRPMPTPKLPNDPVETLMKLNAIAKFDRNPSVRLQLGLDAQRAQVRVVARRDVMGAAAWSRHEFSSYLRTGRVRAALWSDTGAPGTIGPRIPRFAAEPAREDSTAFDPFQRDSCNRPAQRTARVGRGRTGRSPGGAAGPEASAGLGDGLAQSDSGSAGGARPA